MQADLEAFNKHIQTINKAKGQKAVFLTFPSGIFFTKVFTSTIDFEPKKSTGTVYTPADFLFMIIKQ